MNRASNLPHGTRSDSRPSCATKATGRPLATISRCAQSGELTQRSLGVGHHVGGGDEQASSPPLNPVDHPQELAVR